MTIEPDEQEGQVQYVDVTCLNPCAPEAHRWMHTKSTQGYECTVCLQCNARKEGT